MAPNTNRHNYASNKLESIKPQYVKIVIYIESENSEIEFLLLLCCLKQITFFGSFDDFKMYQTC